MNLIDETHMPHFIAKSTKKINMPDRRVFWKKANSPSYSYKVKISPSM